MSTSYRAPFVGIGTGRCGTTSLAYIIDGCRNVKATHERWSLLWYGVDDRVGDMIRDFRESSKNGVLVGDVGQSIGRNVGHLRASFPDLKVICLHRPRDEVIKSFHDYGWQKLRPDDKRAWMDKCYETKDSFVARSIKCFPVIDGYTVDQACGFYWDYYEAMMADIKHPVFHIQTDELNDDSKIHLMFDFLEIPDADRNLIHKRKHWTKEQVEAFKKEASRVTTT